MLLDELGHLEHAARAAPDVAEERQLAIGHLLRQQAVGGGLSPAEESALRDRQQLVSRFAHADPRVERAAFFRELGREPAPPPSSVISAMDRQIDGKKRVFGEPIGDRPRQKKHAAQLRRELGKGFLEGTWEQRASLVRKWVERYRERGDLAPPERG